MNLPIPVEDSARTTPGQSPSASQGHPDPGRFQNDHRRIEYVPDAGDETRDHQKENADACHRPHRRSGGCKGQPPALQCAKRRGDAWATQRCLDTINQHPALAESWMSKGGTCLNKCCFETDRLSEDLDVTRTDPAHIDDAFLSRVFGDIDEWVDEHTGIELPDGGHRSSASASRLGRARARHTRRELLGPVGDIPGDAGGPHGRRQIEPQYWRIRIDGLLAPINPTTLAHCRRVCRRRW